MRHGEGYEYTRDGRVFLGEWKFNVKQGNGIEIFKNSVYKGEWRNNVPHGLGE